MPSGMARICNDATGAKTRFYVANSVERCISAMRWLAALLLGGAAAHAQPLVFDNAPDSAQSALGAMGTDQQAALARASRKGLALTMRASAVSVRGRWADGLPLPLARCDLLTPQRISQAMNALRVAVTAPDAAQRVGGSAGEVEVLWIDVDFTDLQPGTPGVCDGAPTAAVVLRPLHLRLATQRLGDNVLPLARSALGTAYPQVPPALLALNPGFTVRHDRATGTSVGASLRAPTSALADGLEVHAEVQRSVDANYHLADASLQWRAPHSAGLVAEHRLRLAATQRREPLGDAAHEWSASSLGAGLTLRLTPTSRLYLDTGWQAGRDAIQPPAGPHQRYGSQQWTQRLLVDRLFAESLTYARAALWHERTDVAGTDPVGTRAAASLGLSREFRLRPGRLVGVEVGGSVGRASASTLSERRFRGGNPAAALLQDGPLSPALLALPGGPVLRNFGRTQAQLGGGAAGPARGGTRYWSAGLSIALPVARWYRPLIPDESTDLQIADDQPPLTLKQLLMKQVNVTGPNMLAAQLMGQGVPAAEADAQARASLAQVQPAVRYLVEDAPLFAVRPLLMLDTAVLADADASKRWTAAGLGLQVQLATARFEAGYMRTVSGPAGERASGALVFRLTFQNLF